MSDKIAINTDKAPKALGPYSQAILKGSKLYISGQLGINPATGKFPEGAIDAQAKQSLENIKAILEAADFTLDDVVQVQVLLTDIRDFADVNEVYKQYFSEPYPSRAAYQVSALPAAGKVEIITVAEK